MAIDPNTLSRIWNLTFLPKPDRVMQASDLGDTAYQAVSGAAIDDNDAWVELRMAGDTFAFIGTAAPAGADQDDESEFVRSGYPLNRVLPAGERLFIKRSGGTDRRGSCSVWILQGD